MPLLFFVRLSFVSPPLVFCFRPVNTEDLARAPVATMLTRFAFFMAPFMAVFFMAAFFMAAFFMAAFFMAAAFFMGRAMAPSADVGKLWWRKHARCTRLKPERLE